MDEERAQVYVQDRVADFGDPRAPMPLPDASVALLQSGHARRKRNVEEVFVKMPERGNDAGEWCQ